MPVFRTVKDLFKGGAVLLIASLGSMGITGVVLTIAADVLGHAPTP